MSKSFNSNAFNFRPTVMSEAFRIAGITPHQAFVREPKVRGVPADAPSFVVPIAA